MKHFLLLFFGFLAINISAQEVKTQKEFLSLPKTDLVTDFNLKVGTGTIVPVTVSKAMYKDIGFSFVGHKFQYMKGDYSVEILTFQNKKLIQNTTCLLYTSPSPRD